MMFPSLRGGNQNPGVKEGFLGEVNDVLSAADYLAQRPYVDPQRIYLGGHSTGGTLVLLVSEYSDRFRAVFSFGPAENVSGYPSDFVPVSQWNAAEIKLRSPAHWLAGVRSPTFVMEGMIDGNGSSLKAMQRASKNAQLRFHLVKNCNHFSILSPVNRLLAQKILADTGPTCNISLTDNELNALFGG
jgi:dipeptidyl aminopeptidase/acylaminoacyl peptidase